MRLWICVLLIVMFGFGSMEVETARAQEPTPTPFPTVELPWYTPTPLPIHPVALELPGIVPTMIAHYANTAEYSVQWWHTFTNPVSGIDRLLTMFLMGVALFGLSRIFLLIKGRWGQIASGPEAAPTSTALALPEDERRDRSGGYGVRPRVTVERDYKILLPPGK